MNNMISVVVCTYNQEDTIARTLDSILMQQCHVPYEIVIGEDHSTDHTLAICQRYQQQNPERITLLANAYNKGVQDNYFDCLLAACGKYIADCAGDDFWTDPLKLEKEVAILESHPDVTLVHTDWNIFHEPTQTLRLSPPKPFTAPFTLGTDMLQAIVTQTSVPVIQLCTSLYRRSIVIEELLDNPQLFRNKAYGCEDIQIACIMAYRGIIAFLPDVTLSYSTGHESVSESSDPTRQFRFVWRITNLTHHLAEKYQLQGPVIDHYFSRRLLALTMHAFRAHDRLLRQEVIDSKSCWTITADWRTRLVLTITATDATWHLALLLRRAIVSIKHLLKP